MDHLLSTSTGKLRIACDGNTSFLSNMSVLLPVFQDLVKPQWRRVIETLKPAGGLSVSELSRRTGNSYMTVKTHCDELVVAGYLMRTRLPRTEVGRPEIFYSLTRKSDALFPQVGMEMVLEILDELRSMHGESAPERLLFQYFANAAEKIGPPVSLQKTLLGKARKFVELREKDGHAYRFEMENEDRFRLLEFHNPLSRIFEKFPRAQAMELRMIEQLLGCRIYRSEIPTGPEAQAHVVFETA